MKRALLIAATAVVVAGSPLLAANALPRAAAHAPATASDNKLALARGDHGLAWRHIVRLERYRDDSWSRGLRRFRKAFD